MSETKAKNYQVSDFVAGVLAATLAGLTAGSPLAIAATDTVLAAFAKLQAQVAAIAGQPTGGTTGQFLVKNSGTNYDSSWQTVNTAAASKANVNLWQTSV